MSRSLSLYSPVTIEADEFIRFVIDAGGEITDDLRLNGRIASGGCNVWFYEAREQLAGRFEAPEEGVEEKLGAPVRGRVDLQLSHHEGSGPLALAFAYRFARRWPAIATGAAYQVLTVIDVERLLKGTRLPSILGPAVEILFAAVPEPTSSIDSLGGIMIDTNDLDLARSAQQELDAMDGARYDPRHVQVLGVIPSGDTYMWILRRTSTGVDSGSVLGVDERLVAIAACHLGAPPVSLLRVLIGYDASPEAERVALIFSERMLQSQPGVVVGIFDLILDAEGLGTMIELNRGVFLS